MPVNAKVKAIAEEPTPVSTTEVEVKDKAVVEKPTPVPTTEVEVKDKVTPIKVVDSSVQSKPAKGEAKKKQPTKKKQVTEKKESEAKVESVPTVTEQSQQKPKRPRKPKLSRRELIENQANPKSILVGRQKTLTLRYEYCSDILHEYLQMNQSTMLAAYERLAGLLRLVANDKPSYTHVNEWISTNLKICQEQINAMQAQRAALSEDCLDELESLNVNIPDDYHTEFQVSHPVCHKMLAVLKLVDAELNASEDLFMAGILDDASYNSLRTQATTIVRGSVDRIYKATSPGIREGGRFTPLQLAGWIRSGNRMLFSDVPKELDHLVEN